MAIGVFLYFYSSPKPSPEILNPISEPTPNPTPTPEPTPTPTPSPDPIACTQDAKLCPDGSYVSRTGPKCEFASCPVVTPPAICDYAAPPEGCSYVPGPNYNPQSMCGMVLKC